MKPTRDALRWYFDALEGELRAQLQEVVDSKRPIAKDDLITLVAAGVVERAVGKPVPALLEVRRQVEALFDPQIFDDDEGSNPLLALQAVRKRICEEDRDSR